MPEKKDNKEERIIQVRFKKSDFVEKEGRDKIRTNYAQMDGKAIPRFYKFKKSDTPMLMKRKIYNNMKFAWNHGPNDYMEDKWINDTIFIYFDNDPKSREIGKTYNNKNI